MNKEKNLGDYWKGYIEKQIEAVEICKICKYRKRYKELEQKESILDKVTDKLKEDIENAYNNIKHITENDILTTIAREIAIGMKDYAKEILNIIEGKKK